MKMIYRGLFIGLTTIDIQYFTNDFPAANEKIKTGSPDILVGGPASNAAVAFSHLNNGSFLASPVGINPFTTFIADDFNRVGINLFDLTKAQSFSPVLATVITSPNGDRSILTHNPGKINPCISAEKLIEKIRPEILLVDGFYPEFSVQCAKLCKQNSIPVIADCGSWKPQYNELLKYVDIAICSSDFFPPGCKNTDDVFIFSQKSGVNATAISRGGESILYASDKKKGEISISSTNVTDTLGAGDFLHGAFCFYYIEHNNFEEALQHASFLATQACQYKGTRSWLRNPVKTATKQKVLS